MNRISKPGELTAAALLQGIEMDANEADTVLGYLEGHDYCLMTDGRGNVERHDEQEREDHSADIEYSIQEAIEFCQEMNGELSRGNKSLDIPDTDYQERLQKDERILDALMERIIAASG